MSTPTPPFHVRKWEETRREERLGKVRDRGEELWEGR